MGKKRINHIKELNKSTDQKSSINQFHEFILDKIKLCVIPGEPHKAGPLQKVLLNIYSHTTQDLKHKMQNVQKLTVFRNLHIYFYKKHSKRQPCAATLFCAQVIIFTDIWHKMLQLVDSKRR